jgi:N-acetylmuramoyl-L-alanine amidase
MATHVVKQGEVLATIAARHGFSSWKTIYEHPQNARLRRMRPDPNQLFPGDEVFIPERTPLALQHQTGGTLTVSITRPVRELTLRLLDRHHRPLAGETWTLEAGGRVFAGVTDGDGLLTASLPATARTALLFADGQSRELRLGFLNPMREAPDAGISGAQARLANLGYHPGEADGVLGPRTRQALAAFQRDHGLEATGEPGRDTLDKLTEIHGS